MSPIVVECRVCGQKLQAKESHLGKTIKCPGCDAPTLIAEPEASADDVEGVVLERRTYSSEPPAPPQPQPEIAKRRADRESAKPFPPGTGYVVAAMLQLIGAGYFVGSQADQEVMNLQATLYAVGLFIGSQLSLCASILAGIRSRLPKGD